MELARNGEGREADLQFLLVFLQKEIERRKRSEAFNGLSGKFDVHVAESDARVAEEKRVSTASALHTSSSTTNNNSCGFCGNSHSSDRCPNILNVSVDERQNQIRPARLCFRCLGKGHLARGCNAKCSQCKEKHQVICCYKSVEQSTPLHVTPPTPELASASTVSHSVGVACSKSDNLCTVLQTATVQVTGENGCVECTMLFDNGSGRTYVSSKLVQKVNLKFVSSEPVS
jgi:hypothetical protein